MMGFRKYGFAVACVILFHVLVSRGSAGRQNLFLGLRDFSLVQASPDIHEDAVRGFHPISLYKDRIFRDTSRIYLLIMVGISPKIMLVSTPEY